jgi:hypothetical protein
VQTGRDQYWGEKKGDFLPEQSGKIRRFQKLKINRFKNRGKDRSSAVQGTLL